MSVSQCFLFAFIGYNPCFTNSVYHGVFTEAEQIDIICQFALSISQSLGRDVLECFRVLVSCGFFLKCVENASEKSCDADGVYVI